MRDEGKSAAEIRQVLEKEKMQAMLSFVGIFQTRRNIAPATAGSGSISVEIKLPVTDAPVRIFNYFVICHRFPFAGCDAKCF